jgi:hypothetical protein
MGKQKSSIKLFFIGFVAAACFFAGCGGEGGGSASTSETPLTTSSHSRAEFVKLANGICETGADALLTEIGSYVKRHQGEGKGQDELLAQGVQAVFLPKMQAHIEEIRTLGAPSGDQQKVEALLASLQEAVDAADAGEVSSQAQLTKDFKRSAALAREYGLHACAYG